MGTLVNGIKEIFATSQTTATHLPVCASDGTPQGRISVGNLASVLGVGLPIERGSITRDFDIRNAPVGVYRVPGNFGGSYKGLGINSEFVIFFNNKTSSSPQIYDNIVCIGHEPYSSGTLKYYEQQSDTFKSIVYDLPSFYKNYSTLSNLLAGLGGLYNSAQTNVSRLSPIIRIMNETDLNSFEGLCYIDENSTHASLPCYSGIVLSVKCSKILNIDTSLSSMMQVVFIFAPGGSELGFGIKWRVKHNDTWTEWANM